MPLSYCEVKAVKAARYFDSLCKHFARKVEVQRTVEAQHATVLFPMGTCVIGLDGETLTFLCEAQDDHQLEQVKTIISSHVTRLRELRDALVIWRAASHPNATDE